VEGVQKLPNKRKLTRWKGKVAEIDDEVPKTPLEDGQGNEKGKGDP